MKTLLYAPWGSLGGDPLAGRADYGAGMQS